VHLTPQTLVALTIHDPGFESRFLDLSGSGYPPGYYQNVVDSVLCGRQSKAAGDSIRNATQSPKMPYSAVLMEVKN